MNAAKWPNKIGSKDLYREFTFKEWNERACRLANALADMGLKKGDRFAALAYNCAEWMEFYAAAAKGGQICVPIMFRLAPPKMEYVVDHAACKAFFVAKEFAQTVNSIQGKLSTIPKGNYVYWGDDPTPEGYQSYEKLIQEPHLRNQM